ncbi:MAG: 3-oxosteroid 1-dehydrogenase [Streptosporangiales bacterium]|nr:3-oxosteroid 1-dehydrogenase [Streptosporangiales bacterium]
MADEFDVVVVGSGGAGMTAALTAAHHGLSVVLVEKTSYFGGSTARSGGGIWIPGNEVLKSAGLRDYSWQARDYLAHVADGYASAERQDAFLTHGPAMLSFVTSHSPLRLSWVRGYSDYYPEGPGGRQEGRSVEPVPVDAHILKDEEPHLNPPYLPVPDGVAITQGDYRWLSLGPRHPRAIIAGMKFTGRLLKGKLTGKRPVSLGQALVTGLRAGLAQAGVPVWLDTPLTGLEVTDGRVTGVKVTGEHEGTITARKGVILAAGGFERNAEMRRRYQAEPVGDEWTTGSVGNTGEAITAAEEAGAALDLMDDAWWGPSIPMPRGPYFVLAERSLPGCVLVNSEGQRFVNESAPYVDAVHAMYEGHAGGTSHIPSWLIFDQRYQETYVFAGRQPGKRFPNKWYTAGIIHTDPEITGLAARIGADPSVLEKTVARFSEFAAAGKDEDFHRGDSAYDRYYGDPRVKPNPNLAPLAKPPFYAVQIVPGDLGTKGGVVTDERARALRADGSVVEGLYAAGNNSAAVMGHSYAGAGATIGPAMAFGYIAALDLAGA